MAAKLALSPKLPRLPSDLFWKPIQGQDGALVARFWTILGREGGATRLWQGWSESLIQDNGNFLPNYLKVYGIFSPRDGLVALMAETNRPQDLGGSEIAFAVEARFRHRGMGRLALEGGLRLAQHQGSRAAYLEFSPNNLSCLRMCRAKGFHISYDARYHVVQAFCELNWQRHWRCWQRHLSPFAWFAKD